jgi:NAD(P)H-hydrate epimerase
MIPLLTREASRAVDADAVARLGVPSLLLMENAGRGAFEAIRRAFPERLGRVVLVGGPGQNGGDAWVVARHLAVAGFAPRAVLVGDRAKVRGDAAPNLEALERMGVPLRAIDPRGGGLDALDEALRGATLVVDGLFGTGLARAVEGGYAAALARMEAAPAPVVALDLPSGIDADTGRVLGASVHAALTVTFAAMKRGLAQHPGRAYAGRVEVASIGAPAPGASEASLLEARDVAGWLPRRADDAHKGTAGHVVLFTGGPGTLGAALLSGRAALRGGAGLATVAARPEVLHALEARIPELMSHELPHEPSPKRLAPIYEGKRAAVLGPGLGLTSWAQRLTLTVALEAPLPVVIDADGLNALALEGAVDLASAKAPRVLTPHPKEASRLLGASVEEVQGDRFAAAAELARRSGQVVALKGAGTVVAAPGGRMAVCDRGTPALGVGGTGDVLAGALGALLCALPPFEATCAGVYLHALAGELAAGSDRGLFASEVADALPWALERARELGGEAR